MAGPTPPSLFDKRLLIVSGKGGVGKTVVSSALALIASSQGKNVLLVKMDDQGRLAELFGVEAVTDQVGPLRENVSALNIDPITVVSDYFLKQLRIRRLVRHITDSRLFQNWFRVSPAIKEMVCLGKVWDLVEEKTWWRQTPVWDLVVFDAPATGHGLGLLRLPEQASKLLIGPMRRNALGVQAMLQDHATTSLILVTLPEEMPVNETIHFYERVKAEVDMPLACVVLNGAFPRRFADDDEGALAAALAAPSIQAAGQALLEGTAPAAELQAALGEAAEYSRARRALTERYAGELRQRVALPVVEVPYVFSETFGFAELEVVAGELSRGLGAGELDRRRA